MRCSYCTTRHPEAVSKQHTTLRPHLKKKRLSCLMKIGLAFLTQQSNTLWGLHIVITVFFNLFFQNGKSILPYWSSTFPACLRTSEELWLQKLQHFWFQLYKHISCQMQYQLPSKVHLGTLYTRRSKYGEWKEKTHPLLLLSEIRHGADTQRHGSDGYKQHGQAGKDFSW